MSLIRIAARICLVEALKGKTLVGENVQDSMIGAIDVAADGTLRTAQEKPFVAVYSEAAKIEPDPPRGLLGNGATEFVLETGVTAAMVDTDDDGKSTIVGIGIPATDGAMEFLLDVVARQIGDAVSDPDNVWAALFSDFAVRFSAIERVRTSNQGDGVRLAGQQIKISADLIDDPEIAVPLDAKQPIKRFFDLVTTMSEPPPALLAKVTAMQGLLAGTAEPWEQLQRRLGLTAGELLALGRGPIEGDTDRDTPEFATGTLDVDGHGQTNVVPE